jgi:predicted RecB family nuclease
LFPFVLWLPFLLTFHFFFCTLIFFSADLFLLPGLALRVKKQKLLEGIEDMKTLAQTSHNKIEEVIAQAEEELALARLIRHGADRDLVQAQKTVEDLTGKLATTTKNWKALWKSSADDGHSWAQFIPQVSTHF